MPAYVPRQGDFVILSLDPQAGHEQKGRRPGFIISVDQFNRGTGLSFCCPITNTDRVSAFHLPVPPDSGLPGFVMCEQMNSIDYRARNSKRIGTASREFLEEVLSVIDACLFT